MNLSKKANKLFLAKDSLAQGQIESLTAQKKIFLTSAEFTGEQAKTHTGSDEAGIYAGSIIVTRSSDWKEAESIVMQRGFGEKVTGVYGGSWPGASINNN